MPRPGGSGTRALSGEPGPEELRILRSTARPPKLFAGDRLRRLRERHGLSQAALARALALSPSYLNQIERDQRPLPRDVLRRLCDLFGVGTGYFGDGEELRQVGDLREASADPLFGAPAIELAEAQAAVRAAPAVAQRFLALYRAWLALDEENRELRARLASPAAALSRTAPARLPRVASPDHGGGPDAAAVHAPLDEARYASAPLAGSRLPYDDVRDWVQSHRNHFPALDGAAEALFESAGFTAATLRDDLLRHLRDRHGVTAEDAPGQPEDGVLWRLDRNARRLRLAGEMAAESRNFCLAHVVGLLEQGPAMDRLIAAAGPGLPSDEARALARVGLANYFAGALMLPYARFHAEARALLHDVERLQRRFGASFEQVCHRLSTLQRPGLAGVPFYFLKADIAGNVSKRASATRFHFARFGGACPLWNVHQAFAQPGRILTQLARTPDGVAYLCIARTVGGGGGSFLSRPKEVAVGLGCEVTYADQLVYSAGLNLRDPQVVVPIGPGCRACERADCRHRAMPPAGHALDVGTGERGVLPYRIAPPVPPEATDMVPRAS